MGEIYFCLDALESRITLTFRISQIGNVAFNEAYRGNVTKLGDFQFSFSEGAHQTVFQVRIYVSNLVATPLPKVIYVAM